MSSPAAEEGNSENLRQLKDALVRKNCPAKTSCTPSESLMLKIISNHLAVIPESSESIFPKISI